MKAAPGESSSESDNEDQEEDEEKGRSSERVRQLGVSGAPVGKKGQHSAFSL